MAELATFWRAAPARKALAMEAAWELTRARLATLRAAQHYTRHLGALDKTLGAGPAGNVDRDQIVIAARIGRVVAQVARFLPYRALCLQQVIAVRRMLSRRRVPAVVYLGLSREHSGTREAHAWISVGDIVINGNHGLERFAVVGRFS